MNLAIRLIKFIKQPRMHKYTPMEKLSILLLVLLSLFMLMPIVYIINNAFKPYQELFVYPPEIFVRHPTFQSFLSLLSSAKNTSVPISRYIFNSVVVTVLAVISITLVSAMCAFSLSKLKFPGHKLVFSTIILSLLFVPETVAIPRYLIVSHLGIFNTYWAHILPLVAVPTGVFLMKQFMDQIPNELLDSARIDGANEFLLFIRIIIPIIMPAVATIGIIAFRSAWGDEETSTLFMTNPAMRTLPFYISTLTTGMANSVARQGAAAAAALILFLPNLIIFLIFQSKVISTMAHSGIK